MCKIHISVSERRFYWSPGTHTFIYELPVHKCFPATAAAELQQRRHGLQNPRYLLVVLYRKACQSVLHPKVL